MSVLDSSADWDIDVYKLGVDYIRHTDTYIISSKLYV